MELLLNFLSMADVGRASLPYLATPALMFARLGRAIFQTECTPSREPSMAAAKSGTLAAHITWGNT